MNDDALDVIRHALTDEDEIAHGEAVRGGDTSDPRSYEGVGICADCGQEWPCRTQRGIYRLLVRLAILDPTEPTFDARVEFCIHGVSEREECEHCGFGWTPKPTEDGQP